MPVGYTGGGEIRTVEELLRRRHKPCSSYFDNCFDGMLGLSMLSFFSWIELCCGVPPR